MSWQSATPVKPIKPIARSRRPTPESAKLCLLLLKPQVPTSGFPGNGSLVPPLPGLAGGGRQNGGWKVFWIYWDTAWSLIISGIMFTTIVTHPDAEFVEIQAARRVK